MSASGVLEYDHRCYHPGHRGNARPVYYDRTPYQHLERARHHIRTDYNDEMDENVVAIDDGQIDQQPRRRIAVACARCRRRKIKCSGDTGTGQGCSACRSSGVDIVKDCTFNRVGSNDISLVPGMGFEMLPESPISMSAHALTYPSTTTTASRYRSGGLHRASLPTLHTRSALPSDADVQFEASPLEAYAYASSMAPRQDSFTSTYRVEDYRSWPSTTEPLSAPGYSHAYDPQSGLSYGSQPIPSIVVPPSQYPTPRLPSVTEESMSAYNMGHLNTALPGQNIYARRLPIPSVVQDPPPSQYSATEIPVIRPLQSAPYHRNYLRGGNGGFWNAAGSSISPSTMPMTTYGSMPYGLPPAASLAEPAYGYQYSLMPLPSITTSQNVSPTGTVSDASSSSSRSPGGSAAPRYSAAPVHVLPTTTAADCITFSRDASAYTYNECNSNCDNTEANNTHIAGNIQIRETWPAADTESRPSTSLQHYPAGPTHSTSGYGSTGSFSSDTPSGGQPNGNHSSLPLHQPKPQHSGASIETLCRQSSLEQSRSPTLPQQQAHQDKRDRQDRRKQSSISTAQARMSISNFNAPY